MPQYKDHTTEEYVTWLSRPLADNYGISEEDIVNWFMAQKGARPVIQTWGVDKAWLLNTGIPTLKSGLDGGYVMFLMITVSEGGGAGGWINHYASDTSGGALGNMNRDIDYINDVTTHIYPPAMSAPEVGGRYVEDVPGETQRVMDAVPMKSVGSYFMPATMAGNAWVFGTNWCNANQGPKAPSVYFGNPYDQIIANIASFGADPFGDTGATPNPQPDGGQPIETGTDAWNEFTKKIMNKIFDAIRSAFKLKLYDMTVTDHKKIRNSFFNMTRGMANWYYTHLNPAWIENLKNELGAEQDDNNNNAGSNNGSDNSSGSIAGGGGPINEQVYQWCKDRIGQAFDPDGVYGAQCVDLIHQVSIDLSLGLDTSGDYAKNIWNNPVPAGWHKVMGDTGNDDNSANIWNALPNGAIVWFTNLQAGHVAVKSGNWAQCLQQNYNVPGGVGGPITDQNLANWIKYGDPYGGPVGFLGAWVAD